MTSILSQADAARQFAKDEKFLAQQAREYDERVLRELIGAAEEAGFSEELLDRVRFSFSRLTEGRYDS